jgi:hypothetical protein
MKRIFTFLFLSALATGVFAQLETFYDFEEGSADTTWRLFGNGADENDTTDLSIVLNPLAMDPNISDSVLKFLVREDAVRWAGMYTDGCGIMFFTEEAKTLCMMVLKTVVSRVGLKVELSLNSGDDITMYLENSVTDEWELLTFEFNDAVGYYYQRLTVFPDFPEVDKTWGENVVYIDNIGVPKPDNTSVQEFSGAAMKLYPNPVDFRMAVQYPGMTGITVSDVLGRQIRSISFPAVDSKVIEVGDLHSGIYFVTAVTAHGNYTMPFMKK